VDQNDNLNENPLLKQPIAEVPMVDPQFYIDEFLRWLSDEVFEKVQSTKIPVDYTIKNKDWPRLFDSKPEHSEWDHLTKEDNLFNIDEWYKLGIRNISFSHLIFANATLTAIKNNIESFITSYASFLQLTRLLEAPTNNIYSGEIILLNRLKDKLISRINNQSKQLLPILYHFRLYRYSL